MLRDTELAGLARTLGNDTNLSITVGGDSSYCTPDGSRINIARMPATHLGRMLATGLVFHEVAHKKHTKGVRPSGLLGDLTNIIEDVRIEALTIQERPGSGFDLEAVTTYYAEKGGLTPTNTTTALLGLVLSYGYAEILQHRAVAKLHITCQGMLTKALGSAFVRDVLQMLKQGYPGLTSTADTRQLAQRIIDRLKQVPQDDDEASAAQANKNPRESTGSGACSEGQQHQPPDNESPLSDPNKKVSAPEGQQQQKSNPTSGDDTETNSTSNKVPTSPSASNPSPSEHDIGQIIHADNSGYGDRSSALLEDLNELVAQAPKEDRQAIPELPAVQRVTAAERCAEPINASETLATSSRLRSRLLTLLQGKQRRAHAPGCSGRRIDQRRLVKMAFGDPRIFRKKEEVTALNTAVVVLLDGSGSMMSTGGGSTPISSVANASAFALHTSLYHLTGVSAASAVFAARRDTHIRLLADFGEKPGASVFQTRPSGGTPTDTALWYARAALLARPESRKLALIITDGFPDDLESAQAAARRVDRDGIEVVGIGIGTHAVRHLCNQHCVINQVSDLPQALFALLEGVLLNTPSARAV